MQGAVSFHDDSHHGHSQLHIFPALNVAGRLPHPCIRAQRSGAPRPPVCRRQRRCPPGCDDAQCQKAVPMRLHWRSCGAQARAVSRAPR
eukprot:scaffold95244_cov26-Tisochrysis_lutea.AAC.4